MDIAKTATNMAETGTRQDVQFAVQKKIQDIATSTATQLIDAIQPAPSVQNLPAHLGNTINTKA
ncbi:YjfB family protein [Massilia sp. R2A-15]|uniref:YjfB family protein n=1 Tax=Massilia sp. R2A-15 TaxID=3064278 RepID=UPI0027365205|nr:YjfB family protein [Massilia sp. R2A-15]WLI90130.1 YjfB family protein [Massilia sp. R2A-15]